ncbi:MAG TPA: DnaA N-terminal domain-containing protein [Dehalococcoidia bacterium]|nr:DnaA N-terminal domain-containing protein [Dehalococcoidia bacterium]
MTRSRHSGPADDSAPAIGTVRDLRSKAWCWQDKESVRLIRRHWQSAPPEATSLAAALGIYLILTELASNSSSPAEFSAPRRRMAEMAGVSERTLLRYIRAFEALGLLQVEERRVPGDESVQLPNAYLLLDPPAPDGGASTLPGGGSRSVRPEGVAPASPVRPAPPPRKADPSPRQADRTGGGRAHASRSGSGNATDREEGYPLEKHVGEEAGDQSTSEEVWAAARQILARDLTRSNYTTWVEGLRAIGSADGTLTLAAPNGYVLDWVRTRLRSIVERAVAEAARRRLRVDLVLDGVLDGEDGS